MNYFPCPCDSFKIKRPFAALNLSFIAYIVKFNIHTYKN